VKVFVAVGTIIVNVFEVISEFTRIAEVLITYVAEVMLI
jgi:hypothetical protein